jgi:hypothetical protein
MNIEQLREKKAIAKKFLNRGTINGVGIGNNTIRIYYLDKEAFSTVKNDLLKALGDVKVEYIEGFQAKARKDESKVVINPTTGKAEVWSGGKIIGAQG